MYHGAPVISLRVIIDWKAEKGECLRVELGPKFGCRMTILMIALYSSSSLFLRLEFDFSRGLSRWRRELGCFRFCLVWFDQVNLLFRMIPRYWLTGEVEIGLLLNEWGYSLLIPL